MTEIDACPAPASDDVEWDSGTCQGWVRCPPPGPRMSGQSKWSVV